MRAGTLDYMAPEVGARVEKWHPYRQAGRRAALLKGWHPKLHGARGGCLVLLAVLLKGWYPAPYGAEGVTGSRVEQAGPRPVNRLCCHPRPAASGTP